MPPRSGQRPPRNQVLNFLAARWLHLISRWLHLISRRTTDLAPYGCCRSEFGGTEAPKEREEYAPRVRGASMHATRVRFGTGS